MNRESNLTSSSVSKDLLAIMDNEALPQKSELALDLALPRCCEAWLCPAGGDAMISWAAPSFVF